MTTISFTEVTQSTWLSNLPTILNNNFETFKTYLNYILNIVDVDTNNILNIEKITIEKTGATLGTDGITLGTNLGITVPGNVNCGNTISAKNLTLAQGTGITVTNGNLEVSASTSLSHFKGSVKVAKELTYSSYGDTWFEASNSVSYGGNTSLDGAEIIGHISPSYKHGIVLDFTNYTGTATQNVRRIKLLTTNATIGQVVTLVFIINDGDTFQLESSTLYGTSANWATPMVDGIEISKSGTALTLVYLQSGYWLVINDNGNITGGITVV